MKLPGRDRSNEPAEGTQFGPYALEEMVGEGGMGRVFRARRTSDDAVMAVKVIRAATDDESRRRFLHEARAAREVEHRHLVGVEDAGEIDGRPYIAMRFVDGASLDERLKADGPLAAADMLRVVEQIASALDALHAKGIVHRDVKPSNIMLEGDGVASLTDFGIARGSDYTVLTRAGQVLGSLTYLAPEAIRGEGQGRAADIYALGCVAFECLSGRPPFTGRGMFEVGLAHLDAVPPDPCADRPDVPAGLGDVVRLALEKQPDRRPPTAMAFARMLLVAGRSVSP